MGIPSHGDSFISDNEEELCPLCVEEMDLSDKNFKPCPCGYQVCQFCYNNIRENPQLNGRCPACRRPYDDENVEYRMVTQEEMKQDHQRLSRKEKEKKQKERERKETEQTSRRHLAGMRVIQKNLVYVIGLNPSIPTEELHETLRGDQFFGQYGRIQKIVINRRNNANGNPGLGVYVTFSRKEDAARCIAAVDGSINEGKYLRAAYGTTKYCSSYLRGQQCPNPNCMFLHEPGEEADSYTRQDLSTIQHAARQEGLNRPGATRQASSAGATASAKTPAVTDSSYQDNEVHSESALPSGVSWAQKASPPVTTRKLYPLNKHSKSSTDLNATPPTTPAKQAATLVASPPVVATTTTATTVSGSASPVDKSVKLLNNALESLSNGYFQFVFSSELLDEEELDNSSAMPTFFAFANKEEDREAAVQAATKFSDFFAQLNRVKPVGKVGILSGVSLGNDISQDAQTSILHSGMSYNANLPPRPPVPVNVPAGARPSSIPPKGLFGHGSNAQNSHELLAHLMNGNRDDAGQLLRFEQYGISKAEFSQEELLHRWQQNVLDLLRSEFEQHGFEKDRFDQGGLEDEEFEDEESEDEEPHVTCTEVTCFSEWNAVEIHDEPTGFLRSSVIWAPSENILTGSSGFFHPPGLVLPPSHSAIPSAGAEISSVPPTYPYFGPLRNITNPLQHTSESSNGIKDLLTILHKDVESVAPAPRVVFVSDLEKDLTANSDELEEEMAEKDLRRTTTESLQTSLEETSLYDNGENELRDVSADSRTAPNESDAAHSTLKEVQHNSWRNNAVNLEVSTSSLVFENTPGETLDVRRDPIETLLQTETPFANIYELREFLFNKNSKNNHTNDKLPTSSPAIVSSSTSNDRLLDTFKSDSEGLRSIWTKHTALSSFPVLLEYFDDCLKQFAKDVDIPYSTIISSINVKPISETETAENLDEEVSHLQDKCVDRFGTIYLSLRESTFIESQKVSDRCFCMQHDKYDLSHGELANLADFSKSIGFEYFNEDLLPGVYQIISTWYYYLKIGLCFCKKLSFPLKSRNLTHRMVICERTLEILHIKPPYSVDTLSVKIQFLAGIMRADAIHQYNERNTSVIAGGKDERNISVIAVDTDERNEALARLRMIRGLFDKYGDFLRQKNLKGIASAMCSKFQIATKKLAAQKKHVRESMEEYVLHLGLDGYTPQTVEYHSWLGHAGELLERAFLFTSKTIKKYLEKSFTYGQLEVVCERLSVYLFEQEESVLNLPSKSLGRYEHFIRGVVEEDHLDDLHTCIVEDLSALESAVRDAEWYYSRLPDIRASTSLAAETQGSEKKEKKLDNSKKLSKKQKQRLALARSKATMAEEITVEMCEYTSLWEADIVYDGTTPSPGSPAMLGMNRHILSTTLKMKRTKSIPTVADNKDLLAWAAQVVVDVYRYHGNLVTQKYLSQLRRVGSILIYAMASSVARDDDRMVRELKSFLGEIKLILDSVRMQDEFFFLELREYCVILLLHADLMQVYHNSRMEANVTSLRPINESAQILRLLFMEPALKAVTNQSHEEEVLPCLIAVEQDWAVRIWDGQPRRLSFVGVPIDIADSLVNAMLSAETLIYFCTGISVLPQSSQEKANYIMRMLNGFKMELNRLRLFKMKLDGLSQSLAAILKDLLHTVSDSVSQAYYDMDQVKSPFEYDAVGIAEGTLRLEEKASFFYFDQTYIFDVATYPSPDITTMSCLYELFQLLLPYSTGTQTDWPLVPISMMVEQCVQHMTMTYIYFSNRRKPRFRLICKIVENQIRHSLLHCHGLLKPDNVKRGHELVDIAMGIIHNLYTHVPNFMPWVGDVPFLGELFPPGDEVEGSPENDFKPTFATGLKMLQTVSATDKSEALCYTELQSNDMAFVDCYRELNLQSYLKFDTPAFNIDFEELDYEGAFSDALFEPPKFEIPMRDDVVKSQQQVDYMAANWRGQETITLFGPDASELVVAAKKQTDKLMFKLQASLYIHGKSVLKPVGNVNEVIALALTRANGDPKDRATIVNRFLIDLDETSTKFKLGDNATFCVSFAVSRAAAATKKAPLCGQKAIDAPVFLFLFRWRGVVL